MASTARSTPPTLRRAVDREFEDETVFDWLRRQARAGRKPVPPRGITQAAPARVLDKKNAPAGQGEGNARNL